MKYKALLTGNNKMIIGEFFRYMDFDFECLTTSERHDDIVSHLKYINPDVFIYCLNGESTDAIKRFVNVGFEISKKKIPVIIIGDPGECTQFLKIEPLMEVTVIERPVAVQVIRERIVGMLDKKMRMEHKKADEEAESLEDIVESAENLVSKLSAAGQEQEQEQDEEEEKYRKKHVLVVDDDSGVLKLVKSYLSNQYDVATAKSGKVAMKFLETKKTDLVLLDYEMPEENGPQVMAKIRANEKTKNLPIVFLTGVVDKEKIQEVLLMKPQGYLLKPIDLVKLISTVKGVIG